MKNVVIRVFRLYNQPSMKVTVRSFAKINLGLRIGPARADGFHELLTVYQTIGLHDVIHVSVQRGSGIEIRSDDPRVPRDESNTCFKIVQRALDAMNAKGRVVVEIEKRLPVQGGLGGASGNAVATLIALERAMRKRLAASERLRIAAEVGSDIPLFLVGGTVLGVGRGEQVYPVPDLPSMACVVVTPEIGVSTPRAFAEWDRRQGLKPPFSAPSDAALKGRSSTVAPAPSMEAEAVSMDAPVASIGSQAQNMTSARRAAEHSMQLPRKLTRGDGSDRMNGLSRELSAWLSEPYSSAPLRGGRAEKPLLWLVRAGIENDFEQVVFPEYPELREGKRALVRAGAKYASLSGSGSTLFGLFGTKDSAVRAVVRLKKEGWTAKATSTLTRKQYWRRLTGS